ncbi:MAG: amidohydrolase [Paenibacillus sp.]|nr:amidohydrolase [Paenibacillus sp.]
MKSTIVNAINENADTLKQIAAYIGSHPELGNEEVLAFEKLTGELKRQGFHVTSPVVGLSTAFIGEYRSAKPGPTVAFLCEYDALPGLGHACGHHLICTMGVAAAIGLKSVIDEAGGTIRVYGTPAEETKGAKVPMAEAGLFDDVDVALMAHPFHRYEQSGSSLAMDALQFEYTGKAAHAAANPHEGMNALDAVLMLFNAINALRQQLRSDARIHGIITAGGEAANIIPAYAAAQFYIRSASRPYTDEVVRKVLRCAEGAALQTGCALKVSNYEYSYDELVTNRALSDVFTRNLIDLGVAADHIFTGQDHGSLDLGNVSRKCPAIHPLVQVVAETHALHTPQFRDLAMTDFAYERSLLAAKALACAAYDVIAEPELLRRIRTEFEAEM